jgi:hypothetical protein
MRTTLTLEPDVALKLKRRMAAENLTLKEAVNRALRTGLEAKGPKKRVPFKVRPHSFGLKPGYDRDKFNQLVDELEAEEFLRKYNAQKVK